MWAFHPLEGQEPLLTRCLAVLIHVKVCVAAAAWSLWHREGEAFSVIGLGVANVLGFVVAQIAGAGAAVFLFRWLTNESGVRAMITDDRIGERAVAVLAEPPRPD
jgi:hypothetical protein